MQQKLNYFLSSFSTSISLFTFSRFHFSLYSNFGISLHELFVCTRDVYGIYLTFCHTRGNYLFRNFRVLFWCMKHDNETCMILNLNLIFVLLKSVKCCVINELYNKSVLLTYTHTHLWLYHEMIPASIKIR